MTIRLKIIINLAEAEAEQTGVEEKIMYTID